VFLSFSCITYVPRNEKNVSIDGKNIEIILSTDNENVWGLYLNITGKITGEIQLEVERCDSDYKETYNFTEIVNYNYSSKYNTPADYYSNNVIIKIYPKENCKGELVIKYDFGTLKEI
jgi:hypothetical protein